MNRRGVELTVNFVILLAMVVTVFIIFIVITGRYIPSLAGTANATTACEGSAGKLLGDSPQCVATEADCSKRPAREGYKLQVVDARCSTEKPSCCVYGQLSKPLGS
jgi:hypothetical protein